MRVLVTGATGQVGSYLTEHLVALGYEVHVLLRPTSSKENLKAVLNEINLHYGDLKCSSDIRAIVSAVNPREIYHLAADQIVSQSWDRPIEVADVTGLGTTRVLQAARDYCPAARIYHQSSSEIFGRVSCSQQTETTPFNPVNPYADAKAYAHRIAADFRRSFGMFICIGISFSMESPRRRKEFVTRKIAEAAARISLKKQDKLRLGNLDSIRDFGFAGDYCKAIRLTLQQEKPDDYVFATGIPHTIRDFVEAAFRSVDLDWEKYVEVDSTLLRPVDVNYLCGNAAKAKEKLGWEPQVKFEELVWMMVKAELEALNGENENSNMRCA